MCLAKDDHVIEALAPDRTDEALDVRILPGRPGSDEHFGDLEPCHPAPEVSSVDAIAIAQEVPRRRVPREASTICRAVHSAVGCSVTLKCSTRRRSWASTTKTNRIWKVAEGTVKKSIETRSLR